MAAICQARVKGEIEYTLGEKAFYECRPCGSATEATPAAEAAEEEPPLCRECLDRLAAGAADWWGYYDCATPADAPTTDSPSFYAALFEAYKEEHADALESEVTPGQLRAWFAAQLAAAEEEEKEEARAQARAAWHAADNWLRGEGAGAGAGDRFGQFLAQVQQQMAAEAVLGGRPPSATN